MSKPLEQYMKDNAYLAYPQEGDEEAIHCLMQTAERYNINLSEATPEELYEYIRSVSYPNNKAKHLSEMAKMLQNDYQGIVPSELKELIKLPGVGRKTANVIQSVVYQKAAMAVDTHVFRVSHRIGLVPDSCKTPLSVERMLTKYLPKEIIPLAHHWLILHGRYVCRARAPKCGECGIQHICARKFGEFKK